MRRTAVAGLLLALALPALAKETLPPSEDEQVWAQRVAAVLELPPGKLTVVVPRDRKPGEPEASGVKLALRGLTVERLRFPVDAVARAWAAALPEGSVADVRGKEAVRLDGRLAKDEAVVAAARAAAWRPIDGAAARARAALDAAGPARVVVVAIDPKTIRALGPFGGAYRAHHAKVIERLDAAGARGVGLDVFFPENPQQAAGTAAIARAADAARAPVVVAVSTSVGPDGRHVAEPNAAVLLRSKRLRHAAVLAQDELLVRPGAGGAVETATGERVILAESAGLRPLVEELALAASALQPGDLARLGLVEEVQVGARVTDAGVARETVKAIRPEVGAPAGVTTLSYADVHAGRFDRALVKDALVLVGLHDGQDDLVAVPGVGDVSGVFLHAFALRRALQAKFDKDRPQAPPPERAPAPAGRGDDGAGPAAGFADALGKKFEEAAAALGGAGADPKKKK